MFLNFEIETPHYGTDEYWGLLCGVAKVSSFGYEIQFIHPEDDATIHIELDELHPSDQNRIKALLQEQVDERRQWQPGGVA